MAVIVSRTREPRAALVNRGAKWRRRGRKKKDKASRSSESKSPVSLPAAFLSSRHFSLSRDRCAGGSGFIMRARAYMYVHIGAHCARAAATRRVIVIAAGRSARAGYSLVGCVDWEHQPSSFCTGIGSRGRDSYSSGSASASDRVYTVLLWRADGKRVEWKYDRTWRWWLRVMREWVESWLIAVSSRENWSVDASAMVVYGTASLFIFPAARTNNWVLIHTERTCHPIKNGTARGWNNRFWWCLFE